MNFPYWDLHEASLGCWHRESPPPQRALLVRSISLCQDPVSSSPFPGAQCSQDRSGRSIPMSQQSTSPQPPAPWNCLRDCLELQVSARAASAGNWRGLSHSSVAASPRVMKAGGTSSDSLCSLCGRGRAGSWGSCVGDFSTLERVCPGYPPWWQQAIRGVSKHLWGNELPWNRAWGCLEFSHPEVSPLRVLPPWILPPRGSPTT